MRKYNKVVSWVIYSGSSKVKMSTSCLVVVVVMMTVHKQMSFLAALLAN